MNKRWLVFCIIAIAAAALIIVFIVFVGNDETEPDSETIMQYCQQLHENYPPTCPITKIYQCDDYYILGSDCLGTGDLIVDSQGNLLSWCGYTAIDTKSTDCGEYWLDKSGANCTETNNLCIK